MGNKKGTYIPQIPQPLHHLPLHKLQRPWRLGRDGREAGGKVGQRDLVQRVFGGGREEGLKTGGARPWCRRGWWRVLCFFLFLFVSLRGFFAFVFGGCPARWMLGVEHFRVGIGGSAAVGVAVLRVWLPGGRWFG